MGKSIDAVKSSFEKSRDLLRQDIKTIFVQFVKLNAASSVLPLLIVGLVFLVLTSVTGISSPDKLQAFMSSSTILSAMLQNPQFLILIAIIVLLFASGEILATILSSIGLNIIDDAVSDKLTVKPTHKLTDIRGRFRSNFVPVLKLTIFKWMIIIIGMIVIAVIFPLLGSFLGVPGGVSSSYLLFLYVPIVFAVAIFLFAVQFSTMELILGNKGVLDSIKSSAVLVKNNFFAVIATNILLFLISAIGWITVTIIQSLGRSTNLIFSAGGAGTIIGVIYIILAVVINVLVSAAVETVSLPVYYHLWKGYTVKKQQKA